MVDTGGADVSEASFRVKGRLGDVKLHKCTQYNQECLNNFFDFLEYNMCNSTYKSL